MASVRHLLMALGLLLAALFAPAMAAEAFVVHPSQDGVRLSPAELADVLLGRKTVFSDGTRIVVVLLDDDSPLTVQVLKDYVKKSPSQYLAYWKRQVFTGKAAMPKIVATVEEALAVVRGTPGAICFIPADRVGDGVGRVATP